MPGMLGMAERLVGPEQSEGQGGWKEVGSDRGQILWG